MTSVQSAIDERSLNKDSLTHERSIQHQIISILLILYTTPSSIG